MTPDTPHAPRPRDVRRRFERAAATFDGADFVHRHTAAGLLERLAPVVVESKRVLDLGTATGALGRELARHFRRNRVLCVDLSHAMLARARKGRSRFARLSELQADAAQLPLADGSVDVVASNLMLPFVPDLDAVLREVARVLRKGGLFAFASLGPDSLGALAAAWGEDRHVFRFPDMHDLGDGLVRAGLADPVLDVDRLNIDYPDTAALYRDLTACGGRNVLAGRRRGLTGKARFRRADAALAELKRDGTISIALEIVYGHAFGTGQRAAGGEIRFDIADIGRRGR